MSAQTDRVRYIVTDYGEMRVPRDVYVPHPHIMPISESKWYRYQSDRARQAFMRGDPPPDATSDWDDPKSLYSTSDTP